MTQLIHHPIIVIYKTFLILFFITIKIIPRPLFFNFLCINSLVEYPPIMQLIVVLIGLLSFAKMSFCYEYCLDTAVELQIRNKLSLYAIAVDTKDFSLLSEVFTQIAIADYSAPPPNNIYHGLPAIQEFLKESVNTAVTQHTISSTVVDSINGFSPNSTAYVVANCLGHGDLIGQTLFIYGKYMDQWVSESGRWKIKNRHFTLFVS